MLHSQGKIIGDNQNVICKIIPKILLKSSIITAKANITKIEK